MPSSRIATWPVLYLERAFATVLLALVIAGAAPSAFAAAPVTYVRDLPIPLTADELVGIVSFPAGSFAGAAYPPQRFLVTTKFVYLLPSLGSNASPVLLPGAFPTVFDLSTRVTGYVRSDGAREIVMNGAPRNAFRLNVEDGTLNTQSVIPLLITPISSLQTDSLGAGFVLKAEQIWSVDIFNANTVSLLPTEATAAGELLGSTTLSLGPDGLLYVLDLGHNRVVGFTKAGVYQREFPLEPGLAVDLEQQFAVAPDGRFYVGDGTGGGAAYAPSGDFLGTFVSTGTGGGRQLNNLISVDPDGTLLLLDRETFGLHEFVPAIPIEALIADVQALGLGKDEKHLLDKLRAAQKSLDKAKDKTASKELDGFIKEVVGLVKKGRLSADAAAELILDAQAIIDSIPG